VGTARAQEWGAKAHVILRDLLVTLCVWNIEYMLTCVAAEAGEVGI
jgi:hypothetical protein